MSANSRLTIAIHILSFMALAERRRPDPPTSELIANSVNTNPVVIRRMLGMLRTSGLVKSRRGANAGWTLARKPEAITLLDIYKAVEEGPLFGLHAATPNQKCPVGRGVQPVLKKVYGALDEQLRRQLSKTTVIQVLSETID
jgi:Rrf2 family protein